MDSGASSLPSASWKPVILKIVIAVDLVVLLLNFLHSQFQIELFIPAPGKRLNNPLGILLILLFALGVLDPLFRKKWLSRLQDLILIPPGRWWFFGLIFGLEFFLEVMHFLYPTSGFWSLGREQGYGTLFSTVQLFFLGLLVIVVAGKDPEARETVKIRWGWVLLASLYFYLALDDCLGIHENFIKLLRPVAPQDHLLHLIHEWLWVYAPFILGAVVFLAWFFYRKFRHDRKVMALLFGALILWVSVIFLEAVAKNLVDPQGHYYTTLLDGAEEGSEMLGATLFLLGFGRYLKSLSIRDDH